jgi:hypothetical protein
VASLTTARITSAAFGNADQSAMRKCLIALVALGTGLRLWQYCANTAIWLDEIAVARNLIDRSLWDLLTLPLAYDQTAPKGFLLVEKMAISLFGSSDYVLRFFPLFASLVALVIFWRIVAHWLDGFAGIVALALFATGLPYVIYASQVKQYSFDVAVAVLFLWLALACSEQSLSGCKGLWVGVAGAVLAWFSQPAILVVGGLDVALLISAWRGRQKSLAGRLQIIGMVSGVWLISALLSSLAGLASMTPATREYMHRFWAAGFPPIPISRIAGTWWPWDQLNGLLGTAGSASLNQPAPAFYFGLTVLGFALLWRRDRFLASLLLGPIGLALAAATARQYPFSDRLILFLTPSFFIAFGVSAEQIRQWLNRWSAALGASVLVLITVSAVYPMVKTPPVYEVENIKPALAYLRERRGPEDMIYVYYGAAPVVKFYAAAYSLGESAYAVGGCHRGDSRRYFEEIDAFRGRPRVWVFFTHSIPRYREREDVLRYLDAIGLRRDSLATKPHVPPGSRGLGAEVFLYDLSDPVKLSQATSRSSRVTGPSSANERFGCGEGPQAMMSSGGPLTK